MLNLACPIPRDVVVAVSGGPDSMALLNFCFSGRKNVTALHIDHGTQHAVEARQLVEKYCSDNKIPLVVKVVPTSIPHTENNWRQFRLNVYAEFTNTGRWVATAHHSGDNLEWYLLTAIRGHAKFMQACNDEYKLIKPFLFCEKQQLIEWCDDRYIPYVIDPTNIGEDNARAILRESVIPNLLKIHPGMRTSVKNKAMREQ